MKYTEYQDLLPSKKGLSEMTLEELWELFPIFLVPHDARWKEWFNEIGKMLTGLLPDQAVIRISHTGIRNGLRKINYYSYMSKAGVTAVKELLGKEDVTFFHDLALAAQNAMEADAEKAMRVFAKP